MGVSSILFIEFLSNVHWNIFYTPILDRLDSPSQVSPFSES